FLLWYAKDKSQLKYRQLFLEKELGEEGTKGYGHVELQDGMRRRLSSQELEEPSVLPKEARIFKAGDMTSQEAGATTFEYSFEGQTFYPGKNSHWKTNREGMERLRHSYRLFITGKSLSYVRYLDEVPMRPLTNVWTDTGIAGGWGGDKLYAVQTNTKVVERCILMTTDPGDLVFDPTCVRKGTGVLVCQMQASQNSPLLSPSSFPTLSLPASGEGMGGAEILPASGEGKGGAETFPASGEGMGGAETLPASKEGKGETEILPASGEGEVGTETLSVSGEGETETLPASMEFFPTPSLPASGEFFPTPSLPASGEGMGGAETLPASREGMGGAVHLVPIETIKPGDWVLGHDGLPHRVLRVISRYYRGTMIGLRHEKSDKMLWITADHKVLAKLRPRSLGGNLDWSGIPKHLRGRSRELRKEMTPPERKLWQALRNRQMQFKFRRQHPIGPYIADFYSREARLVVEVNGSDFHSTDEAIARDRMRDEYLQSLGLRVLRFPATEVERNLEGVLETIWRVCQEQFSVEGAQWVEARDLAIGDLVFFGPEREGVRIVEIRSEYTEEIVYDLEVEGVHSFITEVCVVHNCGSGTTAYCAEKWGRRWITCDTSRVAIAIARQRLMTAKFDYYELRDPKRGPVGGFVYETVPHITLESIARNTEIDNIAAKYQPQIDQALKDLNEALGTNWQEWEVPREIPHPAWSDEACEIYWKLHQAKNQALQHDPRQVEELLEAIYRLTGHLWKSLKDVPEPIPPSDWSDEVKASLKRFWELKRKKRKEIDDSIKRNASQETLYDRPKVNRSVVRVSGPFTVEAIPVPTIEDPTQAPVPQFEEEEMKARISDRGGDHLTNMLNLLKQQGGVIFPGGKRMELENIRPINLGFLHAEAETKQNGKALRVAISFGPQYGPVTAFQVQEAIPTAKVNGYQVLIFAGFSFDPEAQALIQRTPVAGLQIHLVNIAPDVLVGDLLKATRTSQIFTAFGQPDVRVERQNDGTYIVELLGVDIYDPLTGEVRSTRGEDVAAWFLDTDYDGKTFHICQAFFPNDQNAWEKLQRALKAYIDPEIFDRMRGTVSFPFQLGEHKRIAVKVIDFRGNEVVRVIALERTSY
ncbi:MAG: DUF559 domain-containing protein, partial [Armatimonadetes bacterium]|nr:DUF559 domain-containing protein [Armatimonadota bacterium]